MTKRRGRGDGGLYKRSDGMWCASIDIPSHDGRRKRKVVSSKDRKKAAAKLAEAIKARDEGQLVGSPRMTVASWLDQWLTLVVKPNVRPKTYRHYEQAVRLHLKPQIGGIRLSKLTQADVRRTLVSVQGYSTRAAQKAHQALVKALNVAVGDGLVPRNVAAHVDKPKHARKPSDPLAPLGVRKMINAALDAGDPLASRWAAAFWTGARQAELLGLEWNRVDLEDGFIDISWQLQTLTQEHGCGEPDDQGYPCRRSRPGFCPNRHWELPPGLEWRPCHRSLVWTPTKTAAGQRWVPIAGPLLALLRAHAAATADQPNPHGLVWHHTDGRPIGPREDHRAWHAALARAGLPPTKLHAARDTTATLLMEAKVPEQVRMEIMGHSSVAAHRGYIHVDQGPKRAAMAALEAFMADDDREVS